MVKWVSTKKRLPEYDNHYCVLAKHEYKVVFYNPYHNKWFELGTEIEVDYWLDDFAWHEMMDKNDWDEDWEEQDEIDCLKSEILGYRQALGMSNHINDFNLKECDLLKAENERLKTELANYQITTQMDADGLRELQKDKQEIKAEMLGLAYWIANNNIFHEEGRWRNPDQLLCDTDEELLELYYKHIEKWDAEQKDFDDEPF